MNTNKYYITWKVYTTDSAQFFYKQKWTGVVSKTHDSKITKRCRE